MAQVDDMRRDGRVQMYAEANYEGSSTARMWIMGQLNRQAEKIISEQKSALDKYCPGTPKHLVE